MEEYEEGEKGWMGGYIFKMKRWYQSILTAQTGIIFK